jgi:hypothetical protein
MPTELPGSSNPKGGPDLSSTQPISAGPRPPFEHSNYPVRLADSLIARIALPERTTDIRSSAWSDVRYWAVAVRLVIGLPGGRGAVGAALTDLPGSCARWRGVRVRRSTSQSGLLNVHESGRPPLFHLELFDGLMVISEIVS